MGQKAKWRCRLPRTFFGLNSKYMESVYEQFFILKHHGGWSLTEAYSLPVGLRVWFLKRLQKHFEDEQKQMEEAKRKAKGRKTI